MMTGNLTVFLWASDWVTLVSFLLVRLRFDFISVMFDQLGRARWANRWFPRGFLLLGKIMVWV